MPADGHHASACHLPLAEKERIAQRRCWRPDERSGHRANRADARAGEPLMRLRGLKKYFPITQGILFQRHVGDVHAVDGVDSRSTRERPSDWSARPGAASRRWRAS